MKRGNDANCQLANWTFSTGPVVSWRVSRRHYRDNLSERIGFKLSPFSDLSAHSVQRTDSISKCPDTRSGHAPRAPLPQHGQLSYLATGQIVVAPARLIQSQS
jgi:hypothetical protein